MEQNSNLIQAEATDIIKKFRSQQDRINFCLEKNWFHPKEPGYDATYFLLVLAGKKKYLPCNFSINYKMKFFRKGEQLNKKYIISKMAGNEAYSLYTPDHIAPEKYSKSFLLNLVAYVDPVLFKSLYSIQKQQMLNRNYNAWNNYKVTIKNDLLNDIDNFCPVNKMSKGQTGFRKTKNNAPTGVFLADENDADDSNMNQSQFINENINYQ